MKNCLFKKIFVLLLLALFTAIYPQNSQLKIGLVHSESSLKIDKSNNEPASIAWEYFLLNNKIKYEVLRDDDISSDDLSDFDLIILPETHSLSDDAFQNLTEYIQNSGSVWMLGNTGEMDAKDKVRQKSFIEVILGASLVKESVKNKFSTSLFFTVDELITPTEIAHSNFLLSLKRIIYASTALQKSNLLGYYDLNDKIVNNNVKAGIIASTFGKGRVLWFGFQLDQLIGKNDQHSFKIFYDSAIDWLSNKPFAQLNYLPGFLTSFKLFSAFVNSKESLNRVPDVLKTSENKINLFIPYEIFPNLIQEISFNTLQYSFNLFLTVDEFDKDKITETVSHLSETINLLKLKNYQKNTGLFVDGVIEDFSVFPLIRSSGINFIMDKSNFFIPDEENSFKIFPHYKLIVNSDQLDKSNIPLELNAEKIYNYVLINDLINQHQKNQRLEEKNSYREQTQINSIGIDNLLESISAIENVSLELQSNEEENSFEATISNNNNFDLSNVSFKLYLPEEAAELHYEPFTDNFTLSKLKFQNQYLLNIGSLKSKQKIKLTFNYETDDD